MAYRLSLDAELPASARTVMAGELSRARDSLARTRELDPLAEEAASSLHDARKSLKKARSLLRLLRGAFPRGTYRRQMTQLRDSARAIADARDADSLLGAVAELRKHGAGRVPTVTFDRLEAALSERARAIHASGAPGLVAAVEGLDAALVQIGQWPESEPTMASLLDGLRQAYAAGRAAGRAAVPGSAHGSNGEASVEALHEWRKRVKDLWYQARLIADAWPELLAVEVAQAHRLADVLGEDHDLAILLSLLRGEGSQRLDLAIERGPLIELSERRRGELQASARLLGARLYAERPKAYRRRMAALLQSASGRAVVTALAD